MGKLEHPIQVQICKYLKARNIYFFAVPNGEKRSMITGKKLKEEGVLAGVSDLVVLLKSTPIFIEVKTLKGKQSLEQLEFETKVTQLGYPYYLVRSAEDVDKILKNYKIN